jgi:hypothetical protein
MGSPNSPRRKKARQEKSKIKSIFIIICFHIKGNVHKEFIWANQTVNFAYYSDVSRRLLKIREDFAPNFCDKRNGCCIMTTLRFILYFSPGNFFINNKMTAVLYAPYFSVSPIENKNERSILA